MTSLRESPEERAWFRRQVSSRLRAEAGEDLDNWPTGLCRLLIEAAEALEHAQQAASRLHQALMIRVKGCQAAAEPCVLCACDLPLLGETCDYAEDPEPMLEQRQSIAQLLTQAMRNMQEEQVAAKRLRDSIKDIQRIIRNQRTAHVIPGHDNGFLDTLDHVCRQALDTQPPTIHP